MWKNRSNEMATIMASLSRSIAPDAARGAAALLVAAGHAWQVFLLPLTGARIGMTTMGGLATWSVAVFFLLSGILIGGSISRQVTAGEFSLRDYAVARFFRIYPPLVVAVLVTISCVVVIRIFDLYGAETYHLQGDLGNARSRATIDWSSVVTTLTLTYQLVPRHQFIFFNGPLWSLAFEVWMYVLAGLATFAVIRGSLIGWLATAILVYVMLFVSIAAHPPFWAVGLVWGLGFVYGWGGQISTILFIKRKYLAGSALLICIAVANKEFFAFLPAPYNGFRQHIFYVGCSVILFCGLTSLLQSKRFEESAACQLLAKSANFSYTLYLLHFPLFLLSISMFRPSLLSFGFQGAIVLCGLSFFAVLMISYLVARYVEDRDFQKYLFKTYLLKASSKIRQLQRTS